MCDFSHIPFVLFPVAMYMALNTIGQVAYVMIGGCVDLIEKIAILSCNFPNVAYSMYSYHRASTEERELKQPAIQRSLQWTETEPLSI